MVRVTQPSNIYKFTRANIPVRNLIAVRNVEKQLTKVCKGRQNLPKVATSSQKLASEYLKIIIDSECLRMAQKTSDYLRPFGDPTRPFGDPTRPFGGPTRPFGGPTRPKVSLRIPQN